jgi:hypothetical protein
MMARCCRYLDKAFDWSSRLLTLHDARQQPQIPTAAIFTSALMMCATRLKSLNALEGELRVPRRWEKIVGPRKPSADRRGHANPAGPCRRRPLGYPLAQGARQAAALTPAEGQHAGALSKNPHRLMCRSGPCPAGEGCPAPDEQDPRHVRPQNAPRKYSSSTATPYFYSNPIPPGFSVRSRIVICGIAGHKWISMCFCAVWCMIIDCQVEPTVS